MQDATGSLKNYSVSLAVLILSKMVYYSIFLIFPLVFLPAAWYWIVAGFILMHFTGGLILSTIFQTAHVVPTSEFPLPDDNNEISNNWAVHQLYTTSDFSPESNLFSWFIGGLNYQVVHHLFPDISHIHYKKLAPIVNSTATKYGLPYHVNINFVAAVREHIRMLKLLGNNTGKKEMIGDSQKESYNKSLSFKAIR
jgi:linoleoyl-CoA desaturase